MTNRVLLSFLAISFATVVVGCGADTSNGSPGTGGTPGGGTDPGSGTTPGNGPIDPGCGLQTFPIGLSLQTPNVHLVIDKSGSMKEKVSSSSNVTKWDALTESVNALLTKYDGKVNWGLSLYPEYAPNADECAPGVIDVAIGENTKSAILSKINGIVASTLSGSTPTAQTMEAVSASAGLTDAARNNYVLLMTDGQPNCNAANDVTPAIADLYGAAVSVKTFVVGFGEGTKSNPTLLNQWAEAGHTARTGAATKYFQANSVTELQGAFDEIVGGVASCTYKMGSRPEDSGLITAYIDGKAIPTDGANGFTYDEASLSLTFHGSACTAVKAGAAKVDVVYGCPSGPIL